MELVKQPRGDIAHRHLCGLSAAAAQRKRKLLNCMRKKGISTSTEIRFVYICSCHWDGTRVTRLPTRFLSPFWGFFKFSLLTTALHYVNSKSIMFQKLKPKLHQNKHGWKSVYRDPHSLHHSGRVLPWRRPVIQQSHCCIYSGGDSLCTVNMCAAAK